MADVSDYIQTYTGKKFHFLNPQPEEICLEDIAHALSNTVRWGGHCEPAITVAQHCVMVSRMLRNVGMPFVVQLQGLFHDAAEAYIPDIPSPFKPFFPEVVKIDEMIERAICEKFEIPFPFDVMVKRVDVESYRWEYRDVMRQMGMCEQPTSFRPTLRAWTQLEAREQFLATADALFQELGRKVEAA